jgi:carboxyl-terminal processing protease
MDRAFCLWVFFALGGVGTLGVACQQNVIEAMLDSYVGVGVELTIEAAGARVEKTLPDSAAAKAGLQAKQVILEVNGVGLRGKSLAEVVSMLRGAPNTQVEVLVRTPKGERQLTLTRRALSR